MTNIWAAAITAQYLLALKAQAAELSINITIICQCSTNIWEWVTAATCGTRQRNKFTPTFVIWTKYFTHCCSATFQRQALIIFVITSLDADNCELLVISTVSTCVSRLLAGKDWIWNRVRLCCFYPDGHCDVTANNRRARCSTFQTAALAAHWVRHHALSCQAAWQTGYLCFGVQPVWWHK